MWITCNLLWITQLSTAQTYLSTMLVDTVDNLYTYHNFSIIHIRVFPSAFLIFSCCNDGWRVCPARLWIVANSPTLDGVIFNCHNLSL